MRRALLIGMVLAVLLVLVTGLGVVLLKKKLGVGYVIQLIAPNLPSLPTDPHELGIRPGTEMYAASGERIYTFNQSRQWVRLEDISPHVVHALIATEDAHFYHHRGVDLLAIAGAIRDNLRERSLTRGGSTLTQQLVKRLFFSPEKTFARKLSEALLALQLEAFFAASYPDTNAAWATRLQKSPPRAVPQRSLLRHQRLRYSRRRDHLLRHDPRLAEPAPRRHAHRPG